MMYKSVIEIIQGNLQTQLEGEIIRAVQSVGIDVDKDELLKALAYDRQQYEKGYADAKEKYERPHGKWEKHYHSYFGLHQCVCSECKEDEYWRKFYCYGCEKFCPNCGAIMEVDNV